jgi:hypothetical protein
MLRRNLYEKTFVSSFFGGNGIGGTKSAHLIPFYQNSKLENRKFFVVLKLLSITYEYE